MLSRLSLVGPVVAAGVIFTFAARADDAAIDAIKKTVQVQREVVAYRTKKSTTSMVPRISIIEITTEVVNPDKVHVKEEVDGTLKSESLTDGQRLFVREDPKSEWKEETRDAAKKIKALREDAMTSTPKPGDEIRLSGHEDFKGVPVSVYIWKSVGSLESTITVRIADKDNRLLDETGATKGEFAVLKQTVRIDMSWHKTYEYDPTIKIMLPAPAGP